MRFRYLHWQLVSRAIQICIKIPVGGVEGTFKHHQALVIQVCIKIHDGGEGGEGEQDVSRAALSQSREISPDFCCFYGGGIPFKIVLFGSFPTTLPL